MPGDEARVVSSGVLRGESGKGVPVGGGRWRGRPIGEARVYGGDE